MSTKSFSEIRELYLSFLEKNGHVRIHSASLIPQNDPTTLFTGSGMQPLVPYLLGKDHPEGKRIVDSQKCFRSMDIEEVGDNRHTTFFEMLGNWSLGDYFKKEQLPFFFNFLTDEIQLDASKLYVTVFIGDEKNSVPRDIESVGIWKELFSSKNIPAEVVEIGSEENGYEVGMQGGRIFYYDAKKNWWSRAGTPEKMPVGEIGGPDSEVFYDFGSNPDAEGGHANAGDDIKWGKECHPNCDCGRFLEIGNSVFMQYIKNPDGTFGLLPKQNVDFGGGLERISAAANSDSDVFKVGPLFEIIKKLEELSGKSYSNDEYTHAFRIIADHVRAAIFLIADGVMPSNTDQGYFVRRLLRRSVRFADKLGLPEMSLRELVSLVISEYKGAYPELVNSEDRIQSAIDGEEAKFRLTLQSGLGMIARLAKETEGMQQKMQQTMQPIIKQTQEQLEPIIKHAGELHKQLEPIIQRIQVDTKKAFDIYQSFGFPFEMIKEELERLNRVVNTEEFRALFKKHQELSRAGSEQKFKGGLADGSEATTRLHTAHHLLLKALQTVLGPHVHQRGSNITAERLRIDFSHGEKMTDEQKKEVERIVNSEIDAGLPVIQFQMAKEDAEKLNAEHEFGAKYPDTVSVYSIGPVGASESEPHHAEAFSIEFCGGPHVSNTNELKVAGIFKILKEEASSQGVRRIKASFV